MTSFKIMHTTELDNMQIRPLWAERCSLVNERHVRLCGKYEKIFDNSSPTNILYNRSIFFSAFSTLYCHNSYNIWCDDWRGQNMGATTRHRQTRLVIRSCCGQWLYDSIQLHLAVNLYTDEEMGVTAQRRWKSENDASHAKCLKLRWLF